MKWRTVKLGEIAAMKYGKLPPQGSGEGSFPVFTGYRVAGFCDEYLYDEPEVVVVARGVGGTGDVKMSPEKSWVTNLSIVFRVDAECIDKRFLYYRLGQEPLKDKLNTGAAQAQITIENLQSYQITIPNLAPQKRIADILSAYDDLIENNRRRMALLEEVARQLYREWFVRLRFPGHEHTRMIAGVPEGWRKVSLEEITVKIGSGFTPRGGESIYLQAGTPLIRSLNVYDDLFEDEGLAFISEEHAAALAGVTVESKDILLNITGASVARCCMAPERYLPARVNQHVMIIRIDQEVADPFFVHKAINSDERKRQLLSYAQKGATREALTKEIVARFEVMLPTETLMRQFGELAALAFQQREVLARQKQKLRAARDLLLPRLMSGEIAV